MDLRKRLRFIINCSLVLNILVSTVILTGLLLCGYTSIINGLLADLKSQVDGVVMDASWIIANRMRHNFQSTNSFLLISNDFTQQLYSGMVHAGPRHSQHANGVVYNRNPKPDSNLSVCYRGLFKTEPSALYAEEQASLNDSLLSELTLRPMMRADTDIQLAYIGYENELVKFYPAKYFEEFTDKYEEKNQCYITSYNPVCRPWYRQSFATGLVYQTDMYAYSSGGFGISVCGHATDPLSQRAVQCLDIYTRFGINKARNETEYLSYLEVAKVFVVSKTGGLYLHPLVIGTLASIPTI